MDAATDTWDPEVYDRFRAQRMRPVHELLDLVQPVPGGQVLDLGCGDGRVTRLVHEHVGADVTVGVDSSAAMLGDERDLGGVRLVEDDLATYRPDQPVDVIWANASLQWVPDHPSLLERIWDLLAPGGQLAVQVPANFAHPSHTVADRLGRELGLEPLDRTEAVLSPGAYSTLLHDLGAVEQHVRLRVYEHPMTATAQVVEWVSGSLLTHYCRELGDEAFESFRERYRAELLAELGDPGGDRPYLYPFERILFWARRG